MDIKPRTKGSNKMAQGTQSSVWCRLVDYNCDVYKRHFFLLCLKSRLYMCVYLLLLLLGCFVWFIFIFHYYFYLKYIFLITNHFLFLDYQPKPLSFRDEELLFAWQRLKDGSVPFSSGAISRDEAGSGKAALMKISSDQGESETLHCWVTTQPEAFCS